MNIPSSICSNPLLSFCYCNQIKDTSVLNLKRDGLKLAMYLTKECLGQAQFDCCPPTDDDLHDKLANYLLMKAIFFNNLINKGAKIRNRDPNQKVMY